MLVRISCFWVNFLIFLQMLFDFELWTDCWTFCATADEAPTSPFRERPFSPKPLKKQKIELPIHIFSDVDPFLDLDDATVTGIQPDNLVPVHLPQGSEDTASMEPSFANDFPLSEKSGYSYGTSVLTHSVRSTSHTLIMKAKCLQMFYMLCLIHIRLHVLVMLIFTTTTI